MSISFDATAQTLSLHTHETTYQMQIDPHGFLLHLYYGARTDGSAAYLPTYADRGTCACPHDVADRTFSLDFLPQEYPVQGAGDMRATLLEVRDARGACGCDLRYVRHEVREGKYVLPGMPAVYADAEADGAQTLSVLLRDAPLGLEVELLYGVLPGLDIITRAAVVTNAGDAPVTLERVQTACLDVVHGDFDAITFGGRHAMERQPDRRRVDRGVLSVGSLRGASSHQYNPLVILADHDATEWAGRCWSMSFVWSGNFEATAECDPFGQTRMTMGLADDLFSYPLDPGASFIAPEVIMTHSACGLERLSHNLHRCIRSHVCRGAFRDAPRPVLINSWEAHYFDFTGEDLVRLAERAADLGLDMLVMDDGWFGARSDDKRALGDWSVNEEKLGGTLGELVARVNDAGLDFGIWVEPEMVSEESELYRAHPDWALALPGRDPVLGRDQLVLDLTRKDVRDNVFEQFCAVLDQVPIAYVKWDFNRILVDAFSSAARDQGTVHYEYVLGLYDLLERVSGRYPHLLIEGCAGGGGRFDAGMLYYTPQIWTSDNTDAHDRVSIQHGTSFGYPASAMGSHVSVCPNHITGRVTPLETRGAVAMAGGGFGYELDLMKLSAEECAEVQEQVAAHAEVERLVREGLYYRLSDPATDALGAWEFVSEDGGEALISAVLLRLEGCGVVPYVVPRGLTPGARYRELETGAVYHADALMAMGLPLSSLRTPDASATLRLERVDD